MHMNDDARVQCSGRVHTSLDSVPELSIELEMGYELSTLVLNFLL